MIDFTGMIKARRMYRIFYLGLYSHPIWRFSHPLSIFNTFVLKLGQKKYKYINTLLKMEQNFHFRIKPFQIRTKVYEFTQFNKNWNKILLNRNKTLTFEPTLFKSEQNIISWHNCNEIRNNISLKTVQNFNCWNKTL